MPFGPIDTTSSPYAHWRAIPLDGCTFAEGFWTQRQRINRTVSLRHGYRQLERHGNFNNLRLAAGTGTGEYRRPVFMDSDVYKWLEAVAYDLVAAPDPELEQMAAAAIDLVAAAQMPDGYLDSYWQVVEPDRRWADLDHGHELYCAGHLFQAAVAFYRATGQDRLLRVAQRFADHIDIVFGPGKQQGTPGHPEIETALVELYRATHERRYLDLAAYFLGQRGQGILRGIHRNVGPEYHQDRVSVRETDVVEGHAVRQLYLTAGVADLYLETGEQALLDAQLRQWHDFTAHKLHVTGGAGARHQGEAFGEPYELPNDRAYCETCAQIASIMWNWRLLLATGDGRFADLLEHTLYNGFLSGVSLDGSRYFYVNPLLSRGGIERPEWHGCACCPPNVMRLLASLHCYFATTGEDGVQIHQYAPAALRAALPSGQDAALRMESDFPWHGRVKLSVDESDGSAWTLRLRIPAWAKGWTLQVNGAPQQPTLEQGYAPIERAWAAGDVVELDLPMQPALLQASPRVDPTRHSLAIQRGPVLYCLEEADQEADVNLLDACIDPAAPLTASWQPELLGGVMVVEGAGAVVDAAPWADQLYQPFGSVAETSRPVKLRAVPYYAWANRGPGAMRIWIPRLD